MENKKSSLIKICFIIIAVMLCFFGITILFNDIYNKYPNDYAYPIEPIEWDGTYTIIYYDENNIKYTIDACNDSDMCFDDKMYLEYEEQVQCIKAPCEPVKYKREVNFSKENIEIASKTLKNMIKPPEYIEVEVFDKDLTSDQKRVIKAIISNDESLLKTIDN